MYKCLCNNYETHVPDSTSGLRIFKILKRIPKREWKKTHPDPWTYQT